VKARGPGRAPRVTIALLTCTLVVLAGCDSGTGASKDTTTTTTGAATAKPAVVQAACAGTLKRSTTGTLQSDEQDETSGLVVSAKNRDTLWLNNDSGDSARVFAAAPDGTLRGVYALAGATAIDWEDLAMGPGPTAGAPYLYVGDIGDNDEKRPNIVVYRVAEPEVTGDGGEHTLSNVDALTLQYPDGAHDAEALMVDPRTGDLYIVIKRLTGGPAAVYRAPAGLAAGSTTTLTKVGEIDLPRLPLVASVTAADISRDGAVIGVRTYGGVRLWARGEGQSVVAALKADPCQGPVPIEVQGEALGFRPDTRSYFTVSEGAHAPLHEFSVPTR
jgi:hypothetical protein